MENSFDKFYNAAATSVVDATFRVLSRVISQRPKKCPFIFVSACIRLHSATSAAEAVRYRSSPGKSVEKAQKPKRCIQLCSAKHDVSKESEGEKIQEYEGWKRSARV